MSEILYRPEIGYEKNYESDGTFTYNEDLIPDDNDDDNKTDDLDDKINDIVTILPVLPKDIVKIITPIIKGAKYIYNQIDQDHYNNGETKPPSKIVLKPEDNKDNTDGAGIDTNDEDDDDDLPESIFSKNIDEYDIVIENIDPVIAIENEYSNTLGAILADYLDNLQQKINSYVSNMAVIISESGLVDTAFLDNVYNANTTDIKNKNLLHLSDAIIRSQIVKNQKIRMVKKMFPVDEVISHVRACKVAKDLKERYIVEQYSENDTYLDFAQNMMLSDSQSAYDKKYKENLCNLYKYMNSSVILINECLSMDIQEAQAKLILVKEEGIKI